MAAPAQLPRPLPLAQRSVSVLIAALAVVWPGVGLVLPVSPALGVALIPLALGSVTASLLTTSGRPGVPAAGRRFWRQLSVAGAFAGVAHVPWAYRVVRNGGADGVCYTLPETICFLLSVLFIALALFWLPLGLYTNVHRVTFALDVCMVLAAALLLFRELMYRPMMTSSSGDGTSLWIMIVGATVGMVAAVGLYKISMAGIHGIDSSALRLLGAAVLAGVLGPALDLLIAGYSRLTSAQLALPVACWVAVLGAQRQCVAVVDGALSPRERRRSGPRLQPFSVLPYVATAAVLVLLLLSTRWSSAGERMVVAVGAMLLVMLVATRQILALRENRHLLRSLDAGMTELRNHERRFRSLIQHSSDIIAIARADGALTYISPGVTRVLGSTPAAWLERSAVDLVSPEDAGNAVERFQEALTAPGAVTAFQARLNHADGSRRWVEITLTNLLQDPGIGGVVGNIHDITESREFQQRLHEQASHDGLTGLANRTLFTDRLQQALAGEEPVTVILIDLNNFKQVNDDFGHATGDGLLQVTAKRLRRGTRNGELAARLGGDEFAVLIPGAGEEHAALVADAIATELEPPAQIGIHLLSPGASVGVATCPAGTPADEALRRADVAMYAAKADHAAGRVRRARYTRAIDADFTERAKWESDLRYAADRGEMHLAYQPIVTLADRDVVGVEALLRWNHPERGPIPPATFIPVAERSGLIVALGDWVLRQACRQAAAWHRSYGSRAPRISVNISAHQLREPTFVADVERALRRERLPADRLTVELTECVAAEHETGWDTLSALHALGVRVCLDDFGTGRSCMSLLERCPVDEVKLDRSFTRSVAGGTRRSIATAVLRIADAMGLEAVAEGVETTEQAHRLARLGYRNAQGYLFSRPVTAGEIEPLLCDRHDRLAA